MCIIVLKRKGVDMPSMDTLENCFDNHSDGAGYVYRLHNGLYQIRKGFMKFDSFRESLNSKNFQKDDFVALHFRTATSGNKSPECTHPFPITENVSKLNSRRVKAKDIFIHNGILGKGEGTLSDSQIFSRDILSCLIGAPNLEKTMEVIGRLTTGNKMLIAYGDDLYMLGTWEEDKGVFYSNTSYKHSYFTSRYGHLNYSQYTKRNTTWRDNNTSFDWKKKGNYSVTEYKGNKRIITEYRDGKKATVTSETLPNTKTKKKGKGNQRKGKEFKDFIICKHCNSTLIKDTDLLDDLWFCYNCDAVLTMQGETYVQPAFEDDADADGEPSKENCKIYPECRNIAFEPTNSCYMCDTYWNTIWPSKEDKYYAN